MGELFKYVWLIILAVMYFKKWEKVWAEIKEVKAYNKTAEEPRKLSKASKRWIKLHIVILFLMSYSAWEGQ